jgi:formylglycine-generating enzyme required for sulfatase activity
MKNVAAVAKDHGIEILLHLPMEPLGYPRANPGQGALLMDMNKETLIKTLNDDLDLLPGIVGVNNHMGSRMTSKTLQMTHVLSVVKEHGLFFVDSITTPDTVCRSVADSLSVPWAQRDVFLDNTRNRSEIRKQIHALIRKAEKQGSAIAIGHSDKVTLETLTDEYPQLIKKVRIVPVSELIHEKNLSSKPENAKEPAKSIDDSEKPERTPFKESDPIKKPEPSELVKTNNLGMRFVYIKPGTFMMGSPKNEPGRHDDETLHKVTLTRGYYLQTTEVTQGQWKKVMNGDNPSWFKDCGDDCPVESMEWNDVQKFIKKLNRIDSFGKYRLPTEAEWEYACRAGSDSLYANNNNLDEMGWYEENSGDKTHPVAKKKANGWGLYDMHGNVLEYCSGWYGKYPTKSVSDPRGDSSGQYRIYRGGGCDDSAGTCRSKARDIDDPGHRGGFGGFRVAFSAGQ